MKVLLRYIRNDRTTRKLTLRHSLFIHFGLAVLQEMFRQFKSAPSDSLTYRLAVCMCVVNHSYGGVRAVAHLWQEFVLEMRYRWENNLEIAE